jgi:hypothetical protein
VSCYTRHLAELLPADPSAADKRALDRAVREVLELGDADCPDVWEQVKAHREEHYFAERVAERFARLSDQARPVSRNRGGA